MGVKGTDTTIVYFEHFEMKNNFSQQHGTTSVFKIQAEQNAHFVPQMASTRLEVPMKRR